MIPILINNKYNYIAYFVHTGTYVSHCGQNARHSTMPIAHNQAGSTLCLGCDVQGNPCTAPADPRNKLCTRCTRTARTASGGNLTEWILMSMPPYFRDTLISSIVHYCALTFFVTGYLVPLTPSNTPGRLSNFDAARATRAGHILPASMGKKIACEAMEPNNLMTNSALAELLIGSNSAERIINTDSAVYDLWNLLDHYGLRGRWTSCICVDGWISLERRRKMFSSWIDRCPMSVDGCHVDGSTGDIVSIPTAATGSQQAPTGSGAFAQAPTGSGGFGSPAFTGSGGFGSQAHNTGF